jgi:hypothetical protein
VKSIMLPAFPLGALCLALAAPSPVLADYYRYTDAGGIVHITNKLKSVPAKYRATMKVTREEPKRDAAAQAPPAGQEVAGSQPAPQEQAAPEPAPGLFAQLSSRHVWFKPLVWVAAVVLLFVGVVQLTSVIPSPLLSRLIYISFFTAVSVFLYKAYVTHLVEGTVKVKDRAVSMIKQSSSREAPGPETQDAGAGTEAPQPAVK